MPHPLFGQFVDDAVASLPKKLRDAMDNVAIVVEPFPRIKKVGEREILRGTILLGLYEGVPQIQWGRRQSGLPPDKITIFQSTIESLVADEANLKELIKEVVWHEIGHHFGFNEEEIRKIEARRKQKKTS